VLQPPPCSNHRCTEERTLEGGGGGAEGLEEGGVLLEVGGLGHQQHLLVDAGAKDLLAVLVVELDGGGQLLGVDQGLVVAGGAVRGDVSSRELRKTTPARTQPARRLALRLSFPPAPKTSRPKPPAHPPTTMVSSVTLPLRGVAARSSPSKLVTTATPGALRPATLPVTASVVSKKAASSLFLATFTKAS